MTLGLLKEEDHQEYAYYLKNHPEVPFEYTIEWGNIIRNNFGFRLCYLISRNNGGEIDGVLPLFKAVSLFGKRLVSIPYAISTGILADNKETAAKLLEFAKQFAQEQHADFLEIREKPVSSKSSEITGTDVSAKWYGIFDVPEHQRSDWFCVKNVFNFSLHLSANPQEVWKKLPKGSVRWGITKARKSRLMIHSGNTKRDLDFFYELFLQTRKFRGVPSYPYDYFNDIICQFNDKVKIYTAFLGSNPGTSNIPIASIFLIYYNKEVRYAFAGSVHKPEVMALQPYHLLIWQAITEACEKGYTLLNLGGATLATNDGGLYDFKKKWADTVEEVPYYYFLNKRGKVPAPDKSFLLKIASSVWAKLPVSLIKLLSPRVIRQFV